MKVLFVHKTVPILVNHVEGFFELLNLGLVKHGKDIGGGALRALLGGLSLCLFARHFDCLLPLERSEQTHVVIHPAARHYESLKLLLMEGKHFDLSV